MPRVLILTYYWPPAGSSGVQRWLKFVKYLRDFGWEPVVYTASNPEVAANDDSLSAEIPEGIVVIRKHVPQPYGLYRIVTGNHTGRIGIGFSSHKSSKISLLSRVALWVRGNLFIPDARMLWIGPSSRFLIRYLKEHPVDAIVSTGPPHSMHLIGLRLERKLKIPWIADFRDPWTNIDYFQDLKLTWLAERIHHRLEKKVLSRANLTIAVSKTLKEELESLGARRVEVITNGFDTANYTGSAPTPDPYFSIVHVGSIPPNRNNIPLWRAISRLAKENQGFASQLRIRLVGEVDVAVCQSLADFGLESQVQYVSYLSHSEIASVQQSAQVLLLLVNNSPNAKGILTGKVFEYLAARRPILAIGPKGGDLEKLLTETGAGKVFPMDSEEMIYQGIESYWEEYLKGWVDFDPQGVEKYSRRELSGKFAVFLNQQIGPRGS